jgi:hypothetical protein
MDYNKFVEKLRKELDFKNSVSSGVGQYHLDAIRDYDLLSVYTGKIESRLYKIHQIIDSELERYEKYDAIDTIRVKALRELKTKIEEVIE